MNLRFCVLSAICDDCWGVGSLSFLHSIFTWWLGHNFCQLPMLTAWKIDPTYLKIRAWETSFLGHGNLGLFGLYGSFFARLEDVRGQIIAARWSVEKLGCNNGTTWSALLSRMSDPHGVEIGVVLLPALTLANEFVHSHSDIQTRRACMVFSSDSSTLD